MIKKVVLIFLSVLQIQLLLGQFNYTITSVPDSAKVSVNGVVKGYTPLQLKYRWNQSKDGVTAISVAVDGYKTWTDSITSKPTNFHKSTRVYLERHLPVFEIDSTSALVSFDKLLADFKDGTPVGKYMDNEGKIEVLKWEGSIKIGDKEFEDAFNRIAVNAGFKTPMKKNTELFAGVTNIQPSFPRFLVGARLIECDINLQHSNEKHFGAGSVKGRTNLAFEWQVLDQALGEVVHKYTNVGMSKYRRGFMKNGDNIMAFEEALIDFLTNSQLQELVQQKDIQPTIIKSDNVEIRPRTIVKSEIPEFESLGPLIKHASQSCVTVVTDEGHGSGVVINDEGYILSAYHVVSGVNSVEVHFASGLKQEAKILAYDKDNDIVLLDAAGSGYKSLPLAVDAETTLGDEVITIGTPANISLGQSVAKGIVSGKRLFEGNLFLQTDMAVSPGNSGGPLLNEKGEIIGIVQRKIIDEGVEGIGFALPIERAVNRLKVIIVDQE